MAFIDIHSHYAWNVDDGIETREDAQAALKKAQIQNITKIVATPHLTPGTTTAKEFEQIKERIEELKKLAKEYQIEIYPGCEVMLNGDYLELLDNHQYLTINNGPYLLVEFNVTQKLPEDYDDRLYEYGIKQKIVIAHVERYFHHSIDLNLIQEWIDRGYIIQVNSTSLLGIHGSMIQENAYQLLDNGMVHVIANDVHRPNGKRSVNLQETYEVLAKKYQAEDLTRLMYDNPLAIINLITSPDKKHGKIDFKEVYRHIRTNIEYSTVGKNVKAINVTSSIPSESKSTTSLNLAMIYATKYANVLLIDADLRRPTQHHYLKLSNSRGLTNALIEYGETKKISSKCFQFIEDESFVGKLSVLTSGVKVPNPSELISSDIFEEFINELMKLYDFIVIDCPPVMLVSDAIPIGNVVDGTVFVCSSQLTGRKDAKASIEILQKNNVNILGTVLSQVEVEKDKYNNYYYY